MQPLESIDIRFKVNTSIDKEDICFYSVLQKPFSVHGLIYENGQFRRMPEAVAKSVSPGVHSKMKSPPILLFTPTGDKQYRGCIFNRYIK